MTKDDINKLKGQNFNTGFQSIYNFIQTLTIDYLRKNTGKLVEPGLQLQQMFSNQQTLWKITIILSKEEQPIKIVSFTKKEKNDSFWTFQL